MNQKNDAFDFDDLDGAEAETYADLDLEGDETNLAEFGEADDVPEAEEAPAKPATQSNDKQKRQMLFYGLVAAVLLAGGGFAAYSFMSSTPEVAAPVQAVAAVEQAQQPVEVAPTQPSVDALIGADAGMPTSQQPQQQDVGLFENPEIATQAQAEAATPPADAATAAQAVPAGTDSADPFAALSNTQATAPETAATPVATNAAPMTAANDPFAALTTEQPVPTNAAPETAEALVPQEAAAPVSADAPQAAAETAATPATPSATEEALKQRIAELETKLEESGAQITALNEKLDSLASAKPAIEYTPEAAEDPKAVAEEQPVQQKPKAKAKKKTTAKKPTYDDAYKPAAKTAKEKVATTPAARVELRGVGGSSALVAVNGELRQVRVGETVPGLGRVTDISRGSAGRVVQGTKGSATQ